MFVSNPMRKDQSYYLDVAYCVNCHKAYPLRESDNKALCRECKQDALNWPMKQT